MIKFAGETSTEHYLIIEHYPSRQIPKKRFEVQTVPGRSDPIVVDEGDGDVFDTYQQKYAAFMDAKNPGLSVVAREVAEWLQSKPGFQRLEDSYDPDFYRMAYYTGGEEFSNYFNQYGRGTLTFVCAAPRWYKVGENPIVLTNNQKLYNPSKFKAKPLLTISGSGSGTITFTDLNESPRTLSFTDLSGITIVDPTLHAAIRNGQSVNSTVTGRYEDAYLSKETAIGWTGGISAVTVIPRWWTI